MESFIALLLVLAGIAVMVVSLWHLPKGYASRSWPATSGRIIRAEIEARTDPTWDGPPELFYRAKLQYRYTVGKVEYSGRRIRFGLAEGSQKRAENTIRRYPPGSKVTVYYNPSAPTQAVLERGPQRSSYVGIVLAVVFFVLGAILALGRLY